MNFLQITNKLTKYINMKNIVRTLDYYGYIDDNTMYESKTNDKGQTSQISKQKEYKNKKYIRDDE